MIQRVKSSNLMLKKSFSRTLMSKNHLHSPSKANGSNEKEANFSKVDDKKGNHFNLILPITRSIQIIRVVLPHRILHNTVNS